MINTNIPFPYKGNTGLDRELAQSLQLYWQRISWHAKVPYRFFRVGGLPIKSSIDLYRKDHSDWNLSTKNMNNSTLLTCLLHWHNTLGVKDMGRFPYKIVFMVYNYTFAYCYHFLTIYRKDNCNWNLRTPNIKNSTLLTCLLHWHNTLGRVKDRSRFQYKIVKLILWFIITYATLVWFNASSASTCLAAGY